MQHELDMHISVVMGVVKYLHKSIVMGVVKSLHKPYRTLALVLS